MPHPDHVLAARRLEQRQLLGRAAQRLASAADFRETLRTTIRSCLPMLGDFGFFDVVTPDGVLRTVAAHEAPDIEALLAPTAWAHQPSRADGLNLCALSTGEPALHPDTHDAWLQSIAANEQHLALLRELAFGSMITVPLRHRGDVLGALTLFMGRSGRRHSAEDLEVAGDLAALAAPVVANVRLREQQEQAEQRLRTAVDAGQVGIWDWDIENNRVEWSERVYEMHEMAVGSSPGGVEGFRDRIHPDDRARVTAALQEALAGGAPYAVEFRTVLPGGRIRWIATRSHITRNAQGEPVRMVGASTDITERMELLAAERQARAEAEAAGQRLALLARAAEALAESLDAEDTLQAIARAVVPAVADWCRIDLIDEAGVLQRRLAHHSDPVRAEEALAMARTMRARAETVGSMAWCIRTGQTHHGRFDAPPASDDPVLAKYTSTFGMRSHFILPLVARGRTIGAMGVIQAESGRELSPTDRALIQELAHRAAQALDNARLYAEAASARQQAEAANRAKDEFLAMLGHELRNPLAPIVTALELMGRRDASAHVEERRIVGRQVAHLSRLIDDLLDVSRIAQGKVEIQRMAVDMRQVVAAALEQTQPLYATRTQPVYVHLGPEQMQVRGDAVRLTQVLCNLLINAAKFTPPEGRVTLRLACDGAWVEASVADQGRGIAPDLLPRVFDLFVQGQQSLDRQSGGLGLGLAIVRTLVELHGGSVHAQSAGEGQGSSFTVRLPVSDDGAASMNEGAGSPQGEGSMGANILVVDDNTDAGETLAELLRVTGHEVRTAASGEAALEQLASFRPHLALLDIGLPGMDGYELASRIRKLDGGDALKLVALTGYGRDNDRARALEARFDDHLVKPVQFDKLMETLEKLLKG